MPKLFRSTSWNGRPKIEFVESQNHSFDDRSNVFGFMEAKAAKIINSMLANGVWPVLELLLKTANSRLDEEQRTKFSALEQKQGHQVKPLKFCRMTEWGTHPMIEFSSLEDPEEEDERRRFRFGASKAAKIVRAINVDGLAAVIQAVADIAAGSIDRNAVEVLSLGLPGKLDESVGDGGRCLNVNGAKPDVVLNEINQYLRSVASCDREAARLLVLAKQAIRELVGQGECEPELDNHVNVHAKLGDLVAEVESLL